MTAGWSVTLRWTDRDGTKCARTRPFVSYGLAWAYAGDCEAHKDVHQGRGWWPSGSSDRHVEEPVRVVEVVS